MSERYELVSVRHGKFHRPKNVEFDRNEPAWKPREMVCGRLLEPLNFFLSADDANKYTGGRLAQHLCKHCEQAVQLGR